MKIVQVNISVNPQLGISISGDSFICYQDSALLNVVVDDTGAGSLTYAWTPAAGLNNTDSISVAASRGQHNCRWCTQQSTRQTVVIK